MASLKGNVAQSTTSLSKALNTTEVLRGISCLIAASTDLEEYPIRTNNSETTAKTCSLNLEVCKEEVAECQVEEVNESIGDCSPQDLQSYTVCSAPES